MNLFNTVPVSLAAFGHFADLLIPLGIYLAILIYLFFLATKATNALEKIATTTANLLKEHEKLAQAVQRIEEKTGSAGQKP
jgi:hypothetical protein